jgi:predicted RNase H-like HicB family nuclease
MRLTAAITHEPPWYVARCLEVEVTSQGETIEAARSILRQADRTVEAFNDLRR